MGSVSILVCGCCCQQGGGQSCNLQQSRQHTKAALYGPISHQVHCVLSVTFWKNLQCTAAPAAARQGIAITAVLPASVHTILPYRPWHMMAAAASTRSLLVALLHMAACCAYHSRHGYMLHLSRVMRHTQCCCSCCCSYHDPTCIVPCHNALYREHTLSLQFLSALLASVVLYLIKFYQLQIKHRVLLHPTMGHGMHAAC